MTHPTPAPGGRRRAGRPAGTSTSTRSAAARGSLPVLLVLVLLVGGTLALAGRGGPVPAGAGRTQTVTTPAERQVVCPGSTSDSTTYVGLLAGTGEGTLTAGGRSLDLSPGARQEITDPPRDPVTVITTGDTSRGIFADRVQDQGGVTRCGSPRASWWFTGAGASPAHASRLVVYNPRPGPAVVDVSVFGADGLVSSAGLRGIAVPSGEKRVVELAQAAPTEGNLGVHVQVTRGLVVAAIGDVTQDILDPQARPAAEWLPDQLQPARHVVLGGLPPPAAVDTASAANLPRALTDGAGLVVANPGRTETVVRVRLSGDNGTSVPTELGDTTVPPRSVTTIPLAPAIKERGTAILVDADRPVTAGYVVPGVRDLVHAVPGVHWIGPAAAALPPKATNTLVLTADSGDGSSRAATVTVVQRDEQGGEVDRRRVSVPARSTIAVPLDKDAATVAVSSRGDVVGQVLVERDRTYSALPLSPVLAALRVPDVRPGSR